jgi:hypothetical protein
VNIADRFGTEIALSLGWAAAPKAFTTFDLFPFGFPCFLFRFYLFGSGLLFPAAFHAKSFCAGKRRTAKCTVTHINPHS